MHLVFNGGARGQALIQHRPLIRSWRNDHGQREVFVFVRGERL
jgi:hypothetical protein